MSSEPALDPAAIDALNAVSPDDGGAFLKELIDIYLADVPVRVQEIEQNLQAGNFPALTRAAHSIKGASGNFGARRLAKAALVIESAGKTADAATITAALPELRAAFAAVETEMQQLRAR